MQSNIAPNGMVVTPHHLATQSAVAILKEGGTAMEAAVAAAATISVVYPHMNGIGGDGFWLIVPPHEDPIVIEACGAAGSLATEEFFDGLKEIPYRGPKSAITVAGTVGGWQEALNYVSECGYQRMSLTKLLDDAIRYADEGYPVTHSQRNDTISVDGAANVSYEFYKVYKPDGRIPDVGERFCQKDLANTLRYMAENGLNSFYKGKLADKIVEDMAAMNMPITKSDLENYKPTRKVPLRLLHKYGELYNTPPPTQGLVSLIILGILDKLNIDGKNEGEFIHAAVEATKQAFNIRDQYITDPSCMKINPQALIDTQNVSKLAAKVNLNQALSMNSGKEETDTIWLGVMDNKGFSVSFIQSIYHVFGSGIVLPQTGILWHNRGVAFSLQYDHLLYVKPGKKPYHTLNPAAAKLRDGRTLIYGARGGDGQPQTQAAIFHRYVVQTKDLQNTISAPRWLYGRGAGAHELSLKLEGRFCEKTINYLKARGHELVIIPEYSERVGQAGALVRHTNGMMEGAFDPRSNGSAAGF
ncbi:hypothetical protein K1T71_005775 [Dendrolimus kikuchii]|uniref:Uncharacterized protein n=1 Tax=Dendrolimus kikuchii TaxID=765133 RepID=A0ACC1D5C4_9NEOP|nr:hypothetical protein K1T71_005775 [Dendrolimus kikuchii]